MVLLCSNKPLRLKSTLSANVHPAQLPPDSLTQWRKKLYDASILPIFPQLDRSITLLEEKDRAKKINYGFDGREAESGTIKPTLEKYGWQKGPAGDGGYIDHFIYENKTAGINAILEVEGVFAGGFSYDAEPKLGRLYFVRPQKEKQRWFSFPKDEQDERLIAFDEVEPIFYAEVTGSLHHIRLKEKQTSVNPS